MFNPVSIFIGLRYTQAKRRNHFISFISLMSMLGIALGIIVLITVLSVMNGFDTQIKKRVFSMVPPITVSSVNDYVTNWRDLENIIKHFPDVTAVAPFVKGQVLLTNANNVQPALVNGIDSVEEQHITELGNNMVEGRLSSLLPGSFNIVLGEDLAERLGVMIGDKVTLVTPQMSVSPAGVEPRFKRFTVAGIFRSGGGMGFDSLLAFINLADSQKLFLMENAVSGLHVTIKDVFYAKQVTEAMAKELMPTARITNWTQQYGAFFEAISLEKNMMFFILLLIIAVAVFNLVSTLVMVVNEKEPDIAILRTMGATPKNILAIFMVQGAAIGVVGTLLGVIGGVALATHVTSIVGWLEQVLHVQFISSSVYYIDYLPSELQWLDVAKISMVALFLSFLATLYPAWRAAKVEPAEALRYE